MSGGRQPLETVVVTGGHPYDTAAFASLLSDLATLGIAARTQELEEFVASPREVVAAYRCVVFYFFPLVGPAAEEPGGSPGPRAVLESLLEAGQGLVVLHHALLAYPGWDTWDGVVGASGRDRFTYHGERTLAVEVAEPGHQITAGTRAWSMVDETYRMPEPDGTPLLRVDHPDSMRVIAWCRRFRASRIVCLQSGHDGRAWSAPGFQRVLARGIAWAAEGR